MRHAVEPRLEIAFHIEAFGVTKDFAEQLLREVGGDLFVFSQHAKEVRMNRPAVTGV